MERADELAMQVQELRSRLSLLEVEKTRRDKERKAERDALKARARKEEELRLEHLMVRG